MSVQIIDELARGRRTHLRVGIIVEMRVVEGGVIVVVDGITHFMCGKDRGDIRSIEMVISRGEENIISIDLAGLLLRKGQSRRIGISYR